MPGVSGCRLGREDSAGGASVGRGQEEIQSENRAGALLVLGDVPDKPGAQEAKKAFMDVLQASRLESVSQRLKDGTPRGIGKVVLSAAETADGGWL
jgi:hypothetical protein